MPSNAEIVASARGMVGTKWRHQGRVPGVALDCAGLIVCVGKELDCMYYDSTGYQRESAPEGFVQYFREHGKEIPLARMHAGAVLVLTDHKYPCHCGIIGSNAHGLTLIHAYAFRRRVIEEQLTREWIMRAVGCFEYPRTT